MLSESDLRAYNDRDDRIAWRMGKQNMISITMNNQDSHRQRGLQHQFKIYAFSVNCFNNYFLLIILLSSTGDNRKHAAKSFNFRQIIENSVECRRRIYRWNGLHRPAYFNWWKSPPEWLCINGAVTDWAVEGFLHWTAMQKPFRVILIPTVSLWKKEQLKREKAHVGKW